MKDPTSFCVTPPSGWEVSIECNQQDDSNYASAQQGFQFSTLKNREVVLNVMVFSDENMAELGYSQMLSEYESTNRTAEDEGFLADESIMLSAPDIPACFIFVRSDAVIELVGATDPENTHQCDDSEMFARRSMGGGFPGWVKVGIPLGIGSIVGLALWYRNR